MIKEHDTYDYNTVFTQKDAEVYAKLTDDYNPIHIDREYATATEFGRPVAQGVLILCAFAKVFGTMWPADKLAYFISQNVTYLRPVYIDEPYHIRFECDDRNPRRHHEGQGRQQRGDHRGPHLLQGAFLGSRHIDERPLKYKSLRIVPDTEAFIW